MTEQEEIDHLADVIERHDSKEMAKALLENKQYAIEAAIAEEREACAKIADNPAMELIGCRATMKGIATAIRERGTPQLGVPRQDLPRLP